MAASTAENKDDFLEKEKYIDISCNWKPQTDKKIEDAISTIPLENWEKFDLDEIVSFETCVALFPNKQKNEPCTIDIKLKNNHLIEKMFVVSEATTIEYFKQYGEYAGTVFADFLDDFEDLSVYIAEISMESPTPETSIKFTKTQQKNTEMWLYAIKLVLSKPKPNKMQEGPFDLEMISSFFDNSTDKKSQIARMYFNSFSHDKEYKNVETCVRNLVTNSNQKMEEKTKKDETQKYIDSKIQEMENKILQKIEEAAKRTNEKLDLILSILQNKLSEN